MKSSGLSGPGIAWGSKSNISFRTGRGGQPMLSKLPVPFVGELSFIMYLGDNLIGSTVHGFISKFQSSGPAGVILLK